ncbi:hypothetical protein R3W88_024989 [Solanum pinnatisectum]|uniref:Uncharacterized protein n=1 Tax=Solanum pinnatisectum TaxID=50273 RepID=A0AAV9M294_9SOLN|nr:hypothetical protein R3W88_024989 [Solanum pinnatisectum]
MHSTLLNELPWKGDYYTWNNKQQGNERVCSRLDRALGNSEWMMKWGHAILEYELPNISDDAPMILKVNHCQSNIKVPFRFFNVWAEHSRFESIVRGTWQVRKATQGMHNVWCKLKDLKTIFRKLNNEEFRNIAQRVEIARRNLAEVQQQIKIQYNDNLQMKEADALKELEKWSMIEENIMKQKTKLNGLN